MMWIKLLEIHLLVLSLQLNSMLPLMIVEMRMYYRGLMCCICCVKKFVARRIYTVSII